MSGPGASLTRSPPRPTFALPLAESGASAPRNVAPRWSEVRALSGHRRDRSVRRVGTIGPQLDRSAGQTPEPRLRPTESTPKPHLCPQMDRVAVHGCPPSGHSPRERVSQRGEERICDREWTGNGATVDHLAVATAQATTGACTRVRPVKRKPPPPQPDLAAGVRVLRRSGGEQFASPLGSGQNGVAPVQSVPKGWKPTCSSLGTSFRVGVPVRRPCAHHNQRLLSRAVGAIDESGKDSRRDALPAARRVDEDVYGVPGATAKRQEGSAATAGTPSEGIAAFRSLRVPSTVSRVRTQYWLLGIRLQSDEVTDLISQGKAS